MIQSRCGLLCSQCDYREEMECATCIKMDKPFWGTLCPIKSCCEKQQFSHCGECNHFPCTLFSYDRAQGDDGKRIMQCRKWRENNEKTGL